VRLQGKAAAARANAATSPNVRLLVCCSAADGAQWGVRVMLVILRSARAASATVVFANAQSHSQSKWCRAIDERSQESKLKGLVHPTHRVGARGLNMLTSSLRFPGFWFQLRTPGQRRFLIAMAFQQSLLRHGLPTSPICRGSRPFCSVQQQPKHCRRAACTCSAAHQQQHQQLSLARRQLLAAGAAIVSVRHLPAAAYQPPPPGVPMLLHACMHACTGASQ
jgi:hypothetical protein